MRSGGLLLLGHVWRRELEQRRPSLQDWQAGQQVWRSKPSRPTLTLGPPTLDPQGGRDEETHAGAGGGEGADVNTARFKPDKGFTGADYGKGGGGGQVQVCAWGRGGLRMERAAGRRLPGACWSVMVHGQLWRMPMW